MSTSTKALPTIAPAGNDGWMLAAACAETELDFFVLDDHEEYAELEVEDKLDVVAAQVAVCRQCPVQEACLNFAIENNITDGLWGGKLPETRKDLVAKYNRESNGGRVQGETFIYHGTVNGYNNQGCRCDDCHAAYTADREDRKSPIQVDVVNVERRTRELLNDMPQLGTSEDALDQTDLLDIDNLETVAS